MVAFRFFELLGNAAHDIPKVPKSDPTGRSDLLSPSEMKFRVREVRK